MLPALAASPAPERSASAEKRERIKAALAGTQNVAYLLSLCAGNPRQAQTDDADKTDPLPPVGPGAGPPDGGGDDESEFEVRSQIHEHYIEYSQRHELRLNFDELVM
jgi:hypothetical protein